MIGRVLCATFFVAGLAVYPAAASSPQAASSATATGVTWHRDGLLTWERTEHRAIPPQTLHRLSRDLPPGTSKIIARGSPGVIELRVRYAQRDGGPVHRLVLWSQILKAPHPRTVADGIGHSALSDFEAIGITRMAAIARGALQIIQMDATAYSAECGGCDGMTAIGRRAGHGIVAVDPRIIPLGTHLYILGYGAAIAGDTGGDIVGHRIDLGFDSQRDALLFGRRAVTVYKLK